MLIQTKPFNIYPPWLHMTLPLAREITPTVFSFSSSRGARTYLKTSKTLQALRFPHLSSCFFQIMCSFLIVVTTWEIPNSGRGVGQLVVGANVGQCMWVSLPSASGSSWGRVCRLMVPTLLHVWCLLVLQRGGFSLFFHYYLYSSLLTGNSWLVLSVFHSFLSSPWR